MIRGQCVATWGLAFRQCRTARRAQPRKNLAQLRTVLELELHDTVSLFRFLALAGSQRRDATHFSGAPPQQLSVR
jgi:hypothetical protein